jgi:hypothetical protein
MFLVESQVFLPNPSEKSLVCGLIKSLRKIFMFDGYSNISADVLMDVRIPDALLDLMYRVETVSFGALLLFWIAYYFCYITEERYRAPGSLCGVYQSFVCNTWFFQTVQGKEIK